MKHDEIQINPNQTVLVLGGRGFIGRNIVEQLEKLGASVLIGTHSNSTPRKIGTRKVVFHKLHSPEQCEHFLHGVDIVVNAVGILRQGIVESYEQVHHLAVNHLVNACAKNKIRFVHLSALGLANSNKSRFLTSKLRGEHAILNSHADWCICRPSLIDGDGGYGAKWFRRIAKWPVHITPANAVSKVAPIHVADVGEAIAKITLNSTNLKSIHDRIYELGGDRRVTIVEYLRILRQGSAPLNIKIPAWVAKVSSHLLDLLHLTPFSYGHYELLKFDNCPNSEQTRKLLDQPFRKLGCNVSPRKRDLRFKYLSCINANIKEQ